MSNFFKAITLLFTLSWIIGIAFVTMGGATFSRFVNSYILLFVWLPGVVALAFAKKERIKIRIFSQVWKALYLAVSIALLITALTFIITFPISELRPVEAIRIMTPSFLHFSSLKWMFLSFTFFWISIGLFIYSFVFSLGFLGTEIMMRGYVWAKIKSLGFWRASWITGLVWGSYQAPLVFLGIKSPGNTTVGLISILIQSILLSPILSYLRLTSRGVFIPAYFLGFYHHLTNLFPHFFKSSYHFDTGLAGVSGVIALIITNVVILLRVRKMPLLEHEL